MIIIIYCPAQKQFFFFFYPLQDVILSAMTAIDIDEHHHWIAQMEMLPETFKTIESNVKLLTKIRASLLEEKKKQKKKSGTCIAQGTLSSHV